MKRGHPLAHIWYTGNVKNVSLPYRKGALIMVTNYIGADVDCKMTELAIERKGKIVGTFKRGS